MKRFLAIQHTHSEFLGSVEQQLEGRGIGFSYVRPFTGQALPASALQYDSLWLLGGAHPVTDREHCPWIADELRLIAAFERARRPVVGIGFGGLLLALAAGGEAHAEPAQRAGFTRAHTTEAGRGDALADRLDGRKVLVMMNGGVDLPPITPPLLTDDGGHWIAARTAALSYALLFRPELKPGMLEDMVMEGGRALPDDIGQLIVQARDGWNEMQRTTDLVVASLVSALDLMRERHKPPVFALNPVKDEG